MWLHSTNIYTKEVTQSFNWINISLNSKLEIGCTGMRNVHPKGSMSFIVLKLGQNWQEWIAEIPCGLKILTKSLYLARLRR